MERLLNGTPLRSDGKLTIVSLAAEAGVKRHALTHKHTDLKDLFNARVKAQHSVPASEAALREQNAELRRKLDNMRAERDEYKQAADALAFVGPGHESPGAVPDSRIGMLGVLELADRASGRRSRVRVPLEVIELLVTKGRT
jgi:hypothetical protein